MTISAYPVRVAVDATSLIKLVGPPDKAVYWSLSGSTGTITPINLFTDSQGRAAAIFRPADGQASEAIVLASPVSHYKMDELTGAVMADSVGSLDGSYGGTPDLGQPGIIYGEGKSVGFPDTNDHALANNTGQLLTLHEGDYSVHTWFVVNSIPPGSGSAYNAAYGLMLKQGWHNGLSVNNAGQVVATHYLTGDVAVSCNSGATTVTPGVAYNATMTVSKTDGELFLYVNGSEVGSNTFTAGTAARTNTNPWAFGVGEPGTPTSSYGWPLDGRMQMASLFARTLTPVEVTGINLADPDNQIGNTAIIYATYGA